MLAILTEKRMHSIGGMRRCIYVNGFLWILTETKLLALQFLSQHVNLFTSYLKIISAPLQILVLMSVHAIGEWEGVNRPVPYVLSRCQLCPQSRKGFWADTWGHLTTCTVMVALQPPRPVSCKVPPQWPPFELYMSPTFPLSISLSIKLIEWSNMKQQQSKSHYRRQN